MKSLPVLICLVLMFACLNSLAQVDSNFLRHAVKSVEDYSAANPVEKVYLHLDRERYMPGDTIWFKAYTVAGDDHGLSAISSILHVELLSDKDSVVKRLAVLLGSGLGRGDIAIPAMSKQGAYHIRAYTNWMRNAAPDYFFDKMISLSAAPTDVKVTKNKAAVKPDFQFFPEGGTFVSGLRNRLAVKAVGVNGLGEFVEGSVVDNDGREVAVFKTSHLGMGAFAITPQPGKVYTATITGINKAQFKVNLPVPVEDGFTLVVNNNDTDSITVKITASEKLFAASKNAAYSLIGQSSGKILYATGFKLTAQSFGAHIGKKRFPTGIVQFTLFNEKGEPLNERIVFVQHAEELKLNVSTDKNVFNARRQVKMAIKSVDAFDKPLTGSFSVSVVSEDLAGATNPLNDNIYSSLLLTSDIKGYVEQPGYYFTNVSAQTKADLDLLMLTQGYRRMVWKQVYDGTYPPATYFPENSLDVSGYVKKLGGDKPIPFAKIRLVSTKGGMFLLDTISNAEGRFTIKGLNPDSAVRYMVKGSPAKGNDYVSVSLDTIAGFKTLKVHPEFTELVDTTVITPYQKEIREQLNMKMGKRVVALKEVVVRAQKISPSRGRYIADQTLKDFPEEDASRSLSSYLSSRLNSITFQTGADGTLLPYSNRAIASARFGKAAPMSIILNGFVTDPSIFTTLNVGDIESVEVLRTSGKRDVVTGVADAIIITTKKGDRRRKIATPDAVTFQSNGIYKEREFYSPVYSAGSSSDGIPDLRTTIYWQPDVITDKDGNASIAFYNADTKGTYHVTIEGIDTEGKIGRRTYSYKVE